MQAIELMKRGNKQNDNEQEETTRTLALNDTRVKQILYQINAINPTVDELMHLVRKMRRLATTFKGKEDLRREYKRDFAAFSKWMDARLDRKL